MTSPTMTVLVLAVLWLIVVVPMLVKHKDDRAGERRSPGSAERCGRCPAAARSRPHPAGAARISQPRRPPMLRCSSPAARRGRRSTRGPTAGARRHGGSHVPRPDRQGRHVRRSPSDDGPATTLACRPDGRDGYRAAVGTRCWRHAGVDLGLLCLAPLAGYVLFLRNQALHDRARRQHRQQRSGLVTPRGYDATERLPYRAEADTVVRIDDEDVELRGGRRHGGPDRSVRRGAVRRAVHAPGGVTAALGSRRAV